MNKIIIFLFVFLLLLPGFIKAEDVVNIPYQLAVLHMRSLDPLDSFLGKTDDPTDAVVSEMKWILDSIKHRSINPEEAIADTIYETWHALRENGREMSILETARELSRVVKNTVLFGNKKINFRMTSKYWLVSKITGKDIRTVINTPGTLNY